MVRLQIVCRDRQAITLEFRTREEAEQVRDWFGPLSDWVAIKGVRINTAHVMWVAIT